MTAKKGRGKETTTLATRKSQPEVKPNKNRLEYTSSWIKSQTFNGGFSMKSEYYEVVKGGCDHSENELMFNASACSILFGTMILLAIAAILF